jgi:chemotaxis protein methyltransferase WspC
MDAAEDYYLKALYLDPGCVEALVHLGLCCERRGDSAKAALVRERVRRIEEAVTSR